MDIAVDFPTHSHNGLQRQTKQLGELRQQIDGIECAAEYRQNKRAKKQPPHRACPGLLGVIDDDGRKHQAAAYGKVGEITHEGGAGAFQQKLQQNFYSLTGDSGRGSHIEAAKHYGQLGEIQLVKFRCQKQQGEIQNMQNCCNGRANGNYADPLCLGGLPHSRQESFRNMRKHCQQGNDANAAKEKCQIFIWWAS